MGEKTVPPTNGLAAAGVYRDLQDEFGEGLRPDLRTWLERFHNDPEYEAFARHMAAVELRLIDAERDPETVRHLADAALELARHRAECTDCAYGVCPTWEMAAAAAVGRTVLRVSADVFEDEDGTLRLQDAVLRLLPDGGRPEDVEAANAAARYMLWCAALRIWGRVAAWSMEALCRAGAGTGLRVEAHHLPWEHIGGSP